MKHVRRTAAFLLICVLLLSALPAQAFAAPYPQSTMDAIVSAWNKTVYSESDTTKDTTYRYEGAWQCAAFSRYAFFQLYGHTDHPGNSNNTSKEITCETPTQLLNNLLTYAAPGDAFRLTTSSNTHIMNLYDITEDYKIKVYHSNYGDGDKNKAESRTFASVQALVEKCKLSDVSNGKFTKTVTLQIIHAKDNAKTAADFTGVTQTYTLYCHKNYSRKNYLYGTDFSGALNSDIIYSRDTSVTTVSTDQTTKHNGYSSLKIVNTAAGASGKDLAIVTLTNDRAANGNVADNKEMTLSFWAKASNADTKIYFRWGYGSYVSATLTKDWAYYTLPMNKTTANGSAMHPYVDKAGTVWITEMQLEDGTAATAFVPENTNPINHAILMQSQGQKYQLPDDPVREGYTFGGWYTAKSGGTKITNQTAVKDGDLIVYARWTSICTHNYQSSVITPATCTEAGVVRYTCTLCGDTYTASVPALGHNFVDGVCTRCGAIDPDYVPDVKLTIYGSDTTAVPGSTITIPVMIKGGENFAGFTLTVASSAGLTLKKIEKGALLKNADGMFTANVEQKSVNWTSSTNVAGTGELLVLTFDVSAAAADGSKLTIKLGLKDNKPSNMADANEKPIGVKFEEITVAVQTTLFGDVNGDGEVDTIDAIRLAKYLVDLVELTDAQVKAADVNGDNDVTTTDAIRLAKYLVGLVDSLRQPPVRAAVRAADEAAISVGSATCKSGETVTIPVKISRSPGFAGFTLTINAADGLTLTDIEKGTLLAAAEGMFTKNIAQKRVNWTGSEDVDGDGELLVLTFAVDASAANGDYAVSVELKDGKQSNFANAAEQPIAVSFTAGKVTVSNHEHSYTAVVTPPTCTEQGYTTHTCSCGDSYVDTYVPALGHDIVTDAAVAPTCTETGLTAGEHCTRCDYKVAQEIVSALGHDIVKDAAVAPTCTATGLTAGEHCTRCDYKVAQEVVPSLGHDWDEGKITTPATETTDGVKTYTCTRCGATKTEAIPATGGKPCDGGKDCPSYNFRDVKYGDWYHEAVDFAVINGLFNGMTETTFEPNTAMSRAMLVTVLWRYEGEPKEGTNSFTDVKNGQWYTQAVAWAAHNGIVTGVGNNKFDPNGNITREQMAAILFRYAEKKGFDTSERGDLTKFPDGGKVSYWAGVPVLWSIAENLISGSDGKLLPQGNATRAQVATILMRFIENIAKK